MSKVSELMKINMGNYPKAKKKGLPYEPTISLLNICPETSYSTESCSTIVIAFLVTITRKWKQSKCPSTDKSIMKMYINTSEYYSSVKKNKS